MRNRWTSPLRLLFVLSVLPACVAATQLAPEAPRPDVAARTVYVVGKLNDEDLIMFLTAVAAMEPAPAVVFDSPATAAHLKDFLQQYRPARVISVGSFPDSDSERKRRLGVNVVETVDWKSAPPGPVERVVVCPEKPRGRCACCENGGGARAAFGLAINGMKRRSANGSAWHARVLPSAIPWTPPRQAAA